MNDFTDHVGATRADRQDTATLRAALDRSLDLLQALVAALPERFAYEFSHDSLRVLNSLRAAEAWLVEHGRRGR